MMKGLIKILLREGLLNEGIGWEPIMTEEEAIAWNSSSVYKDFVYHRTFSSNLPTLYANGFQHGKALSHNRGEHRTSCIHHFSSEPTNMTISYGDTLLKCVINVNNPIPYDEFVAFRTDKKSQNEWALKKYGKEFSSLEQNDKLEYYKSKEYGDRNKEFCSKLINSGYDSFLTAPNDIMVFDPKNIVITMKTKGMKDRFNRNVSYLREGLEEKKSVSVVYLKGLLNNVQNNLAKKYLTKWINKGAQGTVGLSPREENLLGIIQRGGIIPQNFTTKN